MLSAKNHETSLKNIRQEIVSLTVSLEDKTQLIDVLRGKIRSRRNQLETVEQIVQENCEKLIEVIKKI